MQLFEVSNKLVNEYPIVISIPHSGTLIPQNIRNRMIESIILPNMDWYLPELYSFIPDMGITVIKSNISRYVVDLNRSLDDSDYTGGYHSLVYQRTTFDRGMYKIPLNEDEIKQRIEMYYLPYHYELEQLLREKLTKFPKVYLLDMHSFFADFYGKPNGDVILSNRDHETSSPQTMSVLSNNLTSEGYIVTENLIKGGHITSGYKKIFGKDIECIQMELRYTVYLEKRYFGEEEVNKWDDVLFSCAQQKLKNVFKNTFEAYRQKIQ